MEDFQDNFESTCEHGIPTNEHCYECEVAIEYQQLLPLSEEFQAAIKEVLKQANLNKCSLIGIILCTEPALISTISNIKEQSKEELVEIFHAYADFIDKRDEKIVYKINLEK
jgi:hypothetical protein